MENLLNALKNHLGSLAVPAAEGAAQGINVMSPMFGPMGHVLNLGVQQQLHGLEPKNSPVPANKDVRDPFVNQIAQASPEMYNQGIPLHAAQTPTPTQQPNPIHTAMKAVLGSADPQMGQQQAANPSVTPTPQIPTSIPGIAPDVSNNMLSLLNNHIFPVTRKYGIPDALVAGQFAQESGFGTKPTKTNNYFGLKSHHGGFAQFDTPEAGAEYYAQTVTNNVPNFDQLKNDPQALLKAIQSQGTKNYEGDNGNPMQYVSDVSKNPAWQAFGQKRIIIPGTT